jgi:hypothetical protein
MKHIPESDCIPAAKNSDRRFILSPYDRREGMELRAAAEHAGRSESTLRGWCVRHGIGRRIGGGNWVVSRVALQMLLDGETDALFEYHLGNRSDARVAEYFVRLGLADVLLQIQQSPQHQQDQQP